MRITTTTTRATWKMKIHCCVRILLLSSSSIACVCALVLWIFVKKIWVSWIVVLKYCNIEFDDTHRKLKIQKQKLKKLREIFFAISPPSSVSLYIYRIARLIATQRNNFRENISTFNCKLLISLVCTIEEVLQFVYILKSIERER